MSRRSSDRSDDVGYARIRRAQVTFMKGEMQFTSRVASETLAKIIRRLSSNFEYALEDDSLHSKSPLKG